MRWHHLLCACLLVAGVTPAAAAPPEPSRSLDRLSLPPRAIVYVLTTGGAELQGELVRASQAGGVELVRADGRMVAVPASDVVRVWRRGDSLRNGLLVGAAIGAAGLVTAAASCRVDCAGFVAGMVVGAGVWTGAGALVDAARTGRTLVYLAP